MTEDENQLMAAAIVFAKKERKNIAKRLTDTAVYVPDEHPTSVFMAGSPGAGKTELSKSVLLLLEKEVGNRVVRIDADEIRALIPGYTGKNSVLFQGAVSLVVDSVHDLVLKNKQNFILDGTFSKYEKAIINVQRSISRGRNVRVMYVYQHPKIAWEFTQIRERVEGRNIPKIAFVEQFLSAREVVKRIADDFKGEKRVTIILVKKDFENSIVEYNNITVQNVSIDDHLSVTYTREELERIL